MAIVVRPPGSIDVIVGMNPALFNPAVHRILLRAGMYQMVMPAVRLLPAGIAIVDNDFLFTRVSVLTGMHAVFLLVQTADGTQTVHEEELLFHPSVYVPFVDMNRNIYEIHGVLPEYRRPEPFAIFTHVYNEDVMLGVWERYYAQFVDHQHLYVIDHGSERPFRHLLNPRTNVVRIPHGEVDHRNITAFCGNFQRFLLSQYQWVMHVDTDEIVVHRHGPQELLQSLTIPAGQVTRRAMHAFDVVHDPRVEAQIDFSAPISVQRNCLVPAPIYTKPILSTAPTTWALGFHYAMEEGILFADQDLWLFHLAHVDVQHTLGRSRNWNQTAASAAEANLWPQNRRVATAEGVAASLVAKLDDTVQPMPDWVRGMF